MPRPQGMLKEFPPRRTPLTTKVKCDEAPGTCANCERVLLACRWPVVRHVLDERAGAAPAPSGSGSSAPGIKAEPPSNDGHSPSSGESR